MINLEMLGIISPHEKNLIREITPLGVKVTTHSLPQDYKLSKIKIYKRVKIRRDLLNQIKTTIKDRDPENTVFFYSQPPIVYDPVLKGLASRFHTILDIRDIWQEHTYIPYLKRKLERWEQVSTMNKVSAVTYVNPEFFSYLHDEIKDRRKLHFLTLGSNRDIFYYDKKTEPLSDKKINLVWCGGVSKLHYVTFWIEVMNYLQKREADVHLTIIGWGNDSEEVNRKIMAYQLKNVTFFNKKYPQEQAARIVRRADYALAGCNPIHNFLYHNALSTKVYDALSCGIPVISLLGSGMDRLNQSLGLSYVNINFNKSNTSISVEEVANRIMNLSVVESTTRERIFDIADCFSYRNIAVTFKQILEHVIGRY